MALHMCRPCGKTVIACLSTGAASVCHLVDSDWQRRHRVCSCESLPSCSEPRTDNSVRWAHAAYRTQSDAFTAWRYGRQTPMHFAATQEAPIWQVIDGRKWASISTYPPAQITLSGCGFMISHFVTGNSRWRSHPMRGRTGGSGRTSSSRPGESMAITASIAGAYAL
jgi:hypothetical protein